MCRLWSYYWHSLKIEDQPIVGDGETNPSTSDKKGSPSLKISMGELSRHNSATDCWVAIDGKVYDFTDFLSEHPPGPDSIVNLAGTDGSKAFYDAHSASMLEDFDVIGELQLPGT